ncbi:MAG: SIS domain-containing protein [Deltaproteobacteria bacterium]|nr:SIS domain-containing protein [Deltaproteobacteria bacterium]
MESLALAAFEELGAALTASKALIGPLASAGRLAADCLISGRGLLLCGNGGSAAEAQHLAAEFVGRFMSERPGLPAVALTADSACLTALGNDYGFEEIFARQVKALGRPGDVLWALSTSGRSPNVLRALETARAAGLRTVFMCGPSPPAPDAAELIIEAPASATPRIQELHLLYGHLICRLAEALIFENRDRPQP